MIRRRSRPPLQFIDLDEADQTPHVMVDGAARQFSVLTLSHWPGSPTPARLRRDLSTEICFAYLGRRAGLLEVEAVTCDHLDEDGLASLKTLVDPEGARRREDRLVGLARAGDFGVVADEEIAKLGFAVQTLFDKERSPIARGASAPISASAWRGQSLAGSLDRLNEMIDHLDRFVSLYEEDYARYSAARQALSRAMLQVSEDPASSLVIVEVAPALAGSPEMASAPTVLPVHPWVIHSASSLPRVLIFGAGQYRYYDRYETWVCYTSRRLAQRRDMTELALRLSEAETGAARWHADLPSSLVPTLSHEGESTLSPSFVLGALRRHLATMPSAFDPFHRAGPGK